MEQVRSSNQQQWAGKGETSRYDVRQTSQETTDSRTLSQSLLKPSPLGVSILRSCPHGHSTLSESLSLRDFGKPLRHSNNFLSIESSDGTLGDF